MSPSLSHSPAGDALMAIARDRSPVEELQCHALLGLLETCDSLTQALNRELARHAHTISGFSILAYLIQHATEVVAPKDIADRLNLPRSAVCAVIGRLEVSGLITHERAQADRRVLTIKVTSAGRRAFESALNHSLASITRLMSALQAKDVAALDVTCARLRQLSTQLSNS